MRQCPNHYAFRAGQNLPDKEFRYLRTVIVTAAVHWGFNSMLAHLLLTFQHREFRYLRTVIVTAAVHWGLSSLLRLR